MWKPAPENLVDSASTPLLLPDSAFSYSHQSTLSHLTALPNTAMKFRKSKTSGRHPLRLIAGMLGLLFLLQLGGLAPAMAQSEAREKIRLLSEALRARDNGDLPTAKSNLEALIRLAPDDESVQRLLAAVNNDLERRIQGQGGVYGQAANQSPEQAMGMPSTTAQQPANRSTAPGETTTTVSAPSRTAGGVSQTDAQRLLSEATQVQRQEQGSAEANVAQAEQMIDQGAFDAAENLLNATRNNLTGGMASAEILARIDTLRAELLLAKAESALDFNRLAEARSLIAQYEQQFGPSASSSELRTKLARSAGDPTRQDLTEISPDFIADQQRIEELLVVARAKLINGDIMGADQTINDILVIDPNNVPAKALKVRAAEALQATTYLNYESTREEMLNEVGDAWARPLIFEETSREETVLEGGSPILEKLSNIVIPRVTFNGELSRVIETLSELSVQYDTNEPDAQLRGVNIVLIDPTGNDPRVNISLRNLSLSRILDFVTKQVNYQFDVDQDAVIVSRGDSSGGNASLVTEFFPISRATVIRLTGFRSDQASASAAPVDPFSPQPVSVQASGPTVSEEEEALKSFFERAGVSFNTVPGATLAFDGTQLIVTQTTRNLERLRNILRRYDQTKQVEIEAKFLEVQQGDLEELGFQWGFFSDGQPTFDPTTGEPVLDSTGRPVLQYDTSFQTGNRSVNSAFSIDPETNGVTITGPAVGNNIFPGGPPATPNTVDLGSDVIGSLFNTVGIIDGDDVQLAIRALSRRTGSDLLSSPRLTVLSGKTAKITVAQELLYPESYGDIQLPSPGGSREGSVSTIAIGAGTPQDFVSRNVGVEMEVTPTVEDNDNISLLLEPKVTEFEGFVEYGGPSVAVGGDGTVVTVPSGFFQPIFSTRNVRTEVTIYDGATVVIGGLVREEVQTIEDKVPVMGDIPFVGRLFRSEGETAQKRNLMIFVTANLVSPGGSPSRQRLDRVEPNTLFQNPVIVTPGGSQLRSGGE